MLNDLTLIILTLLPAALLVALRINAAMVFLSLCLGQVLVELVAKDTDSLISFIAPNAESVSGSALYLIMLLIPAVLTCFMMLFSVHGRLKVALNILPALGSGALLVLLAVPLTTAGFRQAVHELSFWQQLLDAQAMIIGVAAFMSLLFLWTQRPHHPKGHDKHGH